MMALWAKGRPVATPRGRLLLLLSRETNRAAQDRLLDELNALDAAALRDLDSGGPAGVGESGPTR